MGHYKFLDAIFFFFCIFIFVLYVNPKAFSKAAREQAIAEHNRIERAKEHKDKKV